MFLKRNKHKESLEQIDLSSENFTLLGKGTIEDVLHPDADVKVEDTTLSINIHHYGTISDEETVSYTMSEVPALKVSGSRPKFWKGIEEL